MELNRGSSARCILSALIILFSTGAAVASDISIAILDFELNDLTLNLTPNPVNPAELARTATIKTLLARALEEKGGYRIVDIGRQTQSEANAGFGYLYDHPDVAAELGQKFGADWIVVGRNHKASFLFVYFKANLIDTRTKRLVGDFTVEVKGQQQKITPKGIARLAEKIDETLRAWRTGAVSGHAD